MDRQQRKDDLIRFLRSIHRADWPDGAIEDDTDLIGSGLADSLSMIQVILYLEKTYGIDLSDRGVDPAAFGSVADILRLVEEATE